MKLFELLRAFLSNEQQWKGLISMIKTLTLPGKIVMALIIIATTILLLTLTPPEVLGQELGLIVGAQTDGYKIGATVGMMKSISPQLSLFVEGVIRDPQYEASARFAITMPFMGKWKATALLGPEVQSVPKELNETDMTTYLLASTGFALSHPISERATGWIALDWTPTDKAIQSTRFGIGVIAWL